MLEDGLEVRGDETPTVQCTSFDVKGDTSVPPYDDAVIQSQRESQEVSASFEREDLWAALLRKQVRNFLNESA